MLMQTILFFCSAVQTLIQPKVSKYLWSILCDRSKRDMNTTRPCKNHFYVTEWQLLFNSPASSSKERNKLIFEENKLNLAVCLPQDMQAIIYGRSCQFCILFFLLILFHFFTNFRDQCALHSGTPETSSLFTFFRIEMISFSCGTALQDRLFFAYQRSCWRLHFTAAKFARWKVALTLQ